MLRRKWLLRISLGLLLALVLAVGGFFGWREWTRAEGEEQLRQAVAEADAQDPGWRWEELEARRAVIPYPENGGLVVRQAGRALDPKFRSEDASGVKGLLEATPPNQLPDTPTAEKVRRLRDANREALPLALRVAEFPRGRYDLQLAPNPLDTRLSHMDDLRPVLALLALEADLQAQADRPGEALRCVRAMLATGRTIGDEPFAVSQLVRNWAQINAVRQLERILGLCEPRAGLAEMQQLLASEAAEDHLTDGLRGERAMLHRSFEEIEDGKVQLFRSLGNYQRAAPELTDTLPRFLYAPSVPGDHAAALRFLNAAVEASKRPMPEQPAAFRSIPVPLPDGNHVIGRLLLPAVQKAQDADQRTKALLRCAEVAVAAERYRLATDRWPLTLEAIPKDFLAAVPTDPFDGKPLRFAETPEGVIIYSVGPDLQDNEGNLDPVALKPGTDLGFRLWDPDLRRRPAPEPEPEELPVAPRPLDGR